MVQSQLILMQDNQVAEIKSKVDIVSVIGERIELKKAGRNYKANCPFHGEKTPSFMVSPELQIFKCFGCSESGDVFSFLEKFEGMDFPEALKYLADKAGVKLKKTSFSESSEKDKLIEIHSEAVRFYNYLLLEHPVGRRALEYLLNDRGLKMGTIKEFKLGFSPASPYAFKNYLVGKKKFNPIDIEKAGIGINRGASLYDRFSGRVIFPLFDHRGNPVGFSGRVLPWDKRETGKYINSPETLIYHKSSMLYGLNLTRTFIKNKKTAIIVEGELDAISSYQAGIKNVVAIKGSALTEEQVQLLSRFAERFILALDSDMAGDAAARRGLTIAGKAGIEVKVAEIANYKDPDEAARGDVEGYKKDLINSRIVWDYLIDSVFRRFDVSTSTGKEKISREIVPILSSIPNAVSRDDYISKVSSRLGLRNNDAIYEMIRQLVSDNTEEKLNAVLKVVKEDTGQNRQELLEERILTLAFQSDPNVFLEKKTRSMILLPFNKRIIEEYEKFASGKKTFDISSFAENLPGELFPGFAKMVLSDNQNLVENPDELKKELDLVKKELKILWIKEKLIILAAEMRRYEESGEKDKLRDSQNEYNKLARIRAGYEEEESGGIILSEP